MLFESASRRHREALHRRGYRVESQLNLTGALLRNAPWKTYWGASHPELGEVFIKINYGYDPAVNTAVGQKEAWLPPYFDAYYKDVPEIAFPTVVDDWQIENAYAVAFLRFDATRHSLESLVQHPAYTSAISVFLRVWSAIEQPDWWDARYETHDFAHANELPMQPHALAPFGFDLDDNFCIDSKGRLLVFDFEFIQWTSRGLQQLYLALKLLMGKRQALASLVNAGIAVELIEQVEKHECRTVLRQAIQSYRSKLARDGATDAATVLSSRIAEALARWRCR